MSNFDDLLKASECFNYVSSLAKAFIKPDVSYIDICDYIETNIDDYFMQHGITNAGLAFPVGISCNHVAAHDSAIVVDKRVIQKNDIVKIDFGTHVNGHIIDSAFTLYFNDSDTYKQLCEASQEAISVGIKSSGCGAYLKDISKDIFEVFYSYTGNNFDDDIKMFNWNYNLSVPSMFTKKHTNITQIFNLCGHNIKPYIIHGGKLTYPTPIYNGALSKFVEKDTITQYYKTRMEENEVYAFEVFSTTGSGICIPDGITNHFMLNANLSNTYVKKTLRKEKKLYNFYNEIYTIRRTLPFSSRFMNKNFFTRDNNYFGLFNKLITLNIINKYPPLKDKDGCHIAQFENTIIIKNDKIINFNKLDK